MLFPPFRSCVAGIEIEHSITSHGETPELFAEYRLESIQMLLELIRRQNVGLPDDRNNTGVFLSNGGNYYLDAGLHLEYCSPEVTNPRDLVLYEKAGERILEKKQKILKRFRQKLVDYYKS